MKNLLYVSACATFLFFAQSCQQNKQGRNYNTQTKVDQKGLYFIKKGIESSLSEIAMGKVALANSQNPRVTAFANMMIADHTKASNELQQIQSDKKVTADDQLTPDSKKMLASIQTMQGPAFDKAYMQMMVADHQAAIELFNNDGAHNTSATIKNYAEKTLPTLQAHLDSAKSILASLK